MKTLKDFREVMTLLASTGEIQNSRYWKIINEDADAINRLMVADLPSETELPYQAEHHLRRLKVLAETLLIEEKKLKIEKSLENRLKKKKRNFERAARLFVWGSCVAAVVFTIYLFLSPEDYFGLNFLKGLVVFGGVVVVLCIPLIVTRTRLNLGKKSDVEGGSK